MLPREIIYANLEQGDPERPGLTFTGNGRINDMITCSLGPSEIYRPKRWIEGNREFYDDEWGNIWHRLVDGSRGGEICEPALVDWRQLDNLQLPDYDNPRRYERVREVFSQPTDKFRLAGMPGWVFATSRYLRKMEIYFTDLIEYRDEIERLHTIVTDLLVKVVRLYGECGADGIFYCEDLGTQDRALVGPAMWRDVFKPHYERLTAVAHEYGMKVLMHSCGYNWQLLDGLMDAGVDCFQFDQPAVYDLPALAAKLKVRKVGLWSPVDIQQIMPTGDRALIEAEAERMVRLFNGFLIMKNYGDLAGIGVQEEWDMWAYNAILRAAGLPVQD